MFLKNQKGSFLIAFVLCLGMTVMVTTFYYTNQFYFQKISYNKLLYLKSFEALHDSVVNILYSQVSYVKTVKSTLNGDLDKCLRDPNYSCPTGIRPLNLFIDDSLTTIPFISMSAGSGLGINLESCNSFPAMECPFRYDISWKADCDLGQSACVLPAITVKGDMQIYSEIPLKKLFDTDRIKLSMRLR